MVKTWILFFDESGHNRAGSEWAHGFNLTARNAVKKVYSKDYTKPRGAAGFMALSDYEFMFLNYDEIERLYILRKHEL